MHYKAELRFPVQKKEAHTYIGNISTEPLFRWMKNNNGTWKGDGEKAGHGIYQGLRTRDFLLIPPKGGKSPKARAAHIRLLTEMTETGIIAARCEIAYEIQSTCPCLVFGTIEDHDEKIPLDVRWTEVGRMHRKEVRHDWTTPTDEMKIEVFLERFKCTAEAFHKYYNDLWWNVSNQTAPKQLLGTKHPSKTVAAHDFHEIEKLASFGFHP